MSNINHKIAFNSKIFSASHPYRCFNPFIGSQTLHTCIQYIYKYYTFMNCCHDRGDTCSSAVCQLNANEHVHVEFP